MKTLILTILLAATLVGAWCFNTAKDAHTENDEHAHTWSTSSHEMPITKEHCATMPDMPGCEAITHDSHTWSTSVSHHTMNHADMVSDEISFLGEMIPHHQEAVDSSKVLLSKATNPQLISILQNIVSGQAQEITMMTKRLSDMSGWSSYKPMYMPMMSDTSSIQDVSLLEQTYITDMIAHHQWAVDMATKVLTLSPKSEIATFARQIIADQSKEIAIFKSLLEKL